MKRAMSVRGDLPRLDQKPIVSMDKNMIIHCGKVYKRTGGFTVRENRSQVIEDNQEI